MSDFDDLLDTAPRRRRGRPTNEERERRRAEALESAAFQADVRKAAIGQPKVRPEEFLLPMSQNGIARILNMDPATVKQRLLAGGCKPCGATGSTTRPVYLFHEVLPYLVKPKMDIGTYIKTLNAADLPNSINKVFWEAERIKNKTLIETGEAWSTEKVLDVLGEVFMLIKDRIPLIRDSLRDMGLTDEQNAKLLDMTDQFQTDLHEALIEMPKRRQTFSRQSDIDPGDQPIPDIDDDEEDEA